MNIKRTATPRYIILLAIVWMFNSSTGYAQYGGLWKERVAPKPTNSNYEFIDFADSANGWMFTSNGLFTTTSDGGQTWNALKNLPESYKVVGTELYDPLTGIASVEIIGGFRKLLKLFKTTDRGETWSTSILPDTVLFYSALSLLDRNIVGFVSMHNELYLSTNLGESWIIATLPNYLFPPNVVAILKHGKIFIGGGSGTLNSGYLFESADTGKTWSPFNDEENISSVGGHFFNNRLGHLRLYLGDEPLIPETILYNAVNQTMELHYGENLVGALYDDSTVLSFKVGSVVTPLGDSSYQIQSSGSGFRIQNITTISRKYAWILASDNRVFQRIDLLTRVIFADQDVLEGLKEINISVFPIPSNHDCTVRLMTGIFLPSVSVVVFDISGKRVKSLYEGPIVSGMTDIAWDGTNESSMQVASGTYFVLVNSADVLQINRVLINR